ncbi:protein of unknown function [Cnuella takakiae]|uniref:DUF4954 domain-containing protein n=1 Tax=Cnuella takakiae TaxID=1302690 RepID=A0A1M4VJH5_9BACT|nr:DUF4954 family protein [Cnuella takakiae]OLY92580.1 DUF4954 domain-containing protein [Cnuella takakiae]SHE69025.1 protein of unknown function [Cnuella takakiae]
MNAIIKRPLKSLGYGFIPEAQLPEGKDEYHLRNLQNRSGIQYRNLTASEIEKLVRNNNTSDDWNKICVSDDFNPELVKNCTFFGLVRIGKLEPVYLEYNNVALPVGLYNSTIISSDFGDNVVVNNVKYLSHYIIGNEVMIVNVDELHATSYAKFGNGIVKEGEQEGIRVWLEVRNENAGRKIMPFTGMLPGDAYLWSQFREDKELLQRFQEFTEKRFDKKQGYYGKIGDRTVIKNTSIIKDVWIGSDAYIKGANKLKNLTIDSVPHAKTQIGEGCEIVNGIISVGCRVFYGVKAVRFVMASHSQLKYGARLINSYLGNNATISCCEVLNSLIYPAHEQHHNNSFLCAALVMGQSNMAAGATIGSNHNSRAADGELIAGRGFWPGLCVSLKHNSKFASFTILAKGDYPAELNITLPFSLVSNDTANNRLVIMPGYWFQYNMYALARNSAKYVDRDRRKDKVQHIEYDFLAPDTINEMLEALNTMQRLAAQAKGAIREGMTDDDVLAIGAALLEQPEFNKILLSTAPFENSKRPVELLKAHTASRMFRELIGYHFVNQLCSYMQQKQGKTLETVLTELEQEQGIAAWQNIGGQLVPTAHMQQMLADIRSGKTSSWEELHGFYSQQGEQYAWLKLAHAWQALKQTSKISLDNFTTLFAQVVNEAIATRTWMTEKIYQSRAKDYQNAFKQMVYDNEQQMEEVVGSLEDNAFIQQQREELEAFTARVTDMVSRFL